MKAHLEFYSLDEILSKITVCKVVCLSFYSAHGFCEVWYSWLMRLVTFTTCVSLDEAYKPYLGFLFKKLKRNPVPLSFSWDTIKPKHCLSLNKVTINSSIVASWEKKHFSPQSPQFSTNHNSYLIFPNNLFSVSTGKISIKIRNKHFFVSFWQIFSILNVKIVTK